MNDPLASLVIRPGAPGDAARVYKDWLLSFAISDFAHMCTPRADWQRRASQLYFDWQREVIARLLARAELWVASWGEDTSTIAGWCVVERDTVHYVYVAEDYRHHGIASRLLAPALDQPRVKYTHRTPLVRHLPVPPGWTYDPRPALVGHQPKEAA